MSSTTPRTKVEDDAVLEYWARVRDGAEAMPRPGAEAKENKRRCGHLESRIADVLAPESESMAATTRAATREAHEECVGKKLDAHEVMRLKNFRPGTRRVDAHAATETPLETYSMPLAPEDETYGGEEDYGRDDDGYFQYGSDPLPRHMHDWYEPPSEEYGSFVASGPAVVHQPSVVPAAGRVDWSSEERKYATARNLRSHALW
jgi:hypothetical protein